MNGRPSGGNGRGMNAETSYPGLDDSWFTGGTTESPPRRALTRAEVMAELARRQKADQRPDEDDFELDIEEIDRRPKSLPPELDDSWFDRPTRRARR